MRNVFLSFLIFHLFYIDANAFRASVTVPDIVLGALDSIPELTCPSSVTLNVTPFICNAVYTYSVSVNDDESGWTLIQEEGLPSGVAFPMGNTLNTFMVTDADGNTASCSFTVSVIDAIPPVAACDAFLVVNIGIDDPNDCYLPDAVNPFAGVTWVKATVFNDGSYDNCNNIHFTARRLPPYSSFIQGLNITNGHPPCNDLFPDFPSEFERAIAEQDSMKFYCGENGTIQTIALRAYQVNADGNIAIGPDGPIYSECTVQVQVQDKIKPVCMPPANLTLNCEQFDPSLLSHGEPNTLDNCCLAGWTASANYTLFDTVCSRGTLTRVFRVTDCAGNSSSCTQRIIVNYNQQYYIRFPNDTLVQYCNNTGIYGEPQFFGEDCELIGVSYEDEIFGIIHPDACYQIDRTWTVINWCTYNPNLPIINVPNPRPAAGLSYAANNPGPVVSDCNAPAPWSPTITKIFYTDTIETNYCNFWSADANGYRYTQLIKIADKSIPQIFDCQQNTVLIVDSTNNETVYWNDVFDPISPAQDLSEAPADLHIAASDSCSGHNLGIAYKLYLDLDGDNVQETVINSQFPPAPGTVNYGNALLPNQQGGTPTAFDTRAVPPTQLWQFECYKTVLGNVVTGSVRWKNAASPNVHQVPELPYGHHRIEWLVDDGCGNSSTCAYAINVQSPVSECQPPADVVVSCENFDPSLWAYGGFSITPACCIDTIITSVNYSQFDTLCNRGTISRLFSVKSCDGSVQVYTQKIVVQYEQRYFIKFPDDVNADNCSAFQNGNFGEPTFFGEDCELLAVAYQDQIIDVVPDACFRIERDWTVINWCTYNPLAPLVNVPNPNPNPIVNHPSNLPGPIVSACNTQAPWASTVVKINPTDAAPTDYCSFWDASANGYHYTQRIKIVDMTPPSITGCALTDHFNDDTPNDELFWNLDGAPGTPTINLPETEVNISITATDDCTGANLDIQYLLYLDLDADGQAETVVNSKYLGAQLPAWNNVLYNNINTPNFTGGIPIDIDDRPVPADQAYGFAIQQSISGLNKTAAVRWNTSAQPGQYVLPQLPNGKHWIKWLVTDGCGNQKVCEEPFNIGDTSLMVGISSIEHQGFALYQNEPNPFTAETRISFTLPEANDAVLSVFDAEGRVVYRQEGNYGAGTHSMRLSPGSLKYSGIYFYRLESGKHMAWRKMILR